jgi:hypothetical protein
VACWNTPIIANWLEHSWLPHDYNNRERTCDDLLNTRERAACSTGKSMNLLHIHGKCCAYKITPGWLSKKLSWLEYDLLLSGRPSEELTQERALKQGWLFLHLLGLPAGRPAMHTCKLHSLCLASIGGCQGSRLTILHHLIPAVISHQSFRHRLEKNSSIDQRHNAAFS